MLKNENIICISSIDWDFIWQGHQEIMSTLVKNGNRVLYIENTGVRAPGIRDIPRLRKRIKNYFRGIKGIREEQKNLYIFSPVVLPFPYSRVARRINKFLLLNVLIRWIKILDFANPVIWVFLPTDLTFELIRNIGNKLIIYYCIDNFSASSIYAKKIENSEKRILQKADLTFVTSKALYDHCSVYNKSVSFFPFGVNMDNFEKVRLSKTDRPDEFKTINKPIIGYIGGIHKWIDQELVKTICLGLPDFVFVFIGPIQTDILPLSNINNIIFLGSKEHQELPCFIKYFSAAIIPYVVSEYTKNVYPTKLNEYLSMGKPVISTSLPEIVFFNQKYDNIIYIASTPKEFSDSISKALRQNSDYLEKKCIDAAQENSWQKRIEQMSVTIEQAIYRKTIDRDKKWKENVLLFYCKARKNFVRFSLIVSMFYLFIFYTPFIWLLSDSLKITQTPEKADAIVVFAGGVGESGKAGEGYEERVEYAVKLYRQGYAKNIIFSSGYMFVYKEPVIMKALAVSLGVPEEAILIEDKAANTYQNVKFSKKILDEKGWSKILLISSPYHMRRASLVFTNLAKNIKVVYTCVPKSLFYSHEINSETGGRNWQRVNLQQIKGILHEYIGIIYYWYKGYLSGGEKICKS